MIMKNKMLKIINYFGIYAQQRKLQEEVFELQEEITSSKYEYSGGRISEELADVRNVLDQIQEYYKISDEYLNEIREKKIERTLERIEKGYYDKKEE